jgi:hypothetical protein
MLRGEGRCTLTLAFGLFAESSTSWSRDCRKLGPPDSGSIRLGAGECGLVEVLARCGDDLELVPMGAADWLVRLLLTTGVADSPGVAAGDDGPDFRFFRREELGSADAARA